MAKDDTFRIIYVILKELYENQKRGNPSYILLLHNYPLYCVIIQKVF